MIRLFVWALSACVAMSVASAVHADLKKSAPRIPKKIQKPLTDRQPLTNLQDQIPVLEPLPSEPTPATDPQQNMETEAQLLYDYLRTTGGMTDEQALYVLKAGEFPTDKVIRH